MMSADLRSYLKLLKDVLEELKAHMNNYVALNEKIIAKIEVAIKDESQSTMVSMCCDHLTRCLVNIAKYAINFTTQMNAFNVEKHDPGGIFMSLSKYVEEMQNLNQKSVPEAVHITRSTNETKNKLDGGFYDTKSFDVIKAMDTYIEQGKLPPTINKDSVGDSFELSENRSNLYQQLKENFGYENHDLNKYKNGSILKGVVTYIKDLEKLEFFILDVNDEDYKKIFQISLDNKYKSRPKDEPFGIYLDKKVYRAVFSKVSEENSKKQKALLLDFGEIIELSPNEILYRLPNEYKQIKPLAMPAVLTSIPINEKETIKEVLSLLENNIPTFIVHSVEDGVLKLILDDFECLTQTPEQNQSSSLAKESLEEKKTENHYEVGLSNSTNLTQEELEMLWEEPLSTANPMVALMGYDPKDDTRICKFYDPKTGACFKGANCRLEHTPKNPDGWTKDLKINNMLALNVQRFIKFAIGAKVILKPTFIVSPTKFYAHIDDPNYDNSLLVWKPSDIPKISIMRKPPSPYEIVRARYKDNLWYRAQIEFSDSTKQFPVFFIDYGYRMEVPLKDLAFADKSTSFIPPQAHLFYIAHIQNACNTQQKIVDCVTFLNEKIINRPIEVTVVQQIDENVFIALNGDCSSLTKELIKKGYASKGVSKLY